MATKTKIRALECQSIKVFLIGGTGSAQEGGAQMIQCQSIKVFLIGGTKKEEIAWK